MIDPLDLPIRLADLPSLIPQARPGKPVSRSTVARWANVGIKGVRLETTLSGGTVLTTLAAYERFNARLNALRTGRPAPPPVARQVVAQAKAKAYGLT